MVLKAVKVLPGRLWLRWKSASTFAAPRNSFRGILPTEGCVEDGEPTVYCALHQSPPVVVPPVTPVPIRHRIEGALIPSFMYYHFGQ